MRYSKRTLLHDGLYAAKTKEYSSWLNMINRCKLGYSESQYYYQKGITVCSRWKGNDAFLNFYQDMGKRPENTSLDRIDSSKGYTPENCRWATPHQQSLNRKLQSNNTTGYRGVYWNKKFKKYQSQIQNAGRLQSLGYYHDDKEAALAYDTAAIQINGMYAKTNLLEVL